MTTALAKIQGNLTTGSLDQYIQAANQIPMLSAEEETRLANRLIQDGDMNAARHLVMAHLRFVVRVAKGYNGYGLALADLIQEGNIGLMKAVKRFDPDKKVRLVSFAVHWIRAEIHEFILRNWRIVKIATTKAQRKLFFNLRSAKKRLAWFNQAEINQLAEDLGVSPKVVVEMEARMSNGDVSFDLPVDDEENPHAPVNYLQDTQGVDPYKDLEENDWENHNHERLADALANLDERSQDILKQRWLMESKTTLQDLADKYQVSAERIRQLENNALKKLKKYF